LVLAGLRPAALPTPLPASLVALESLPEELELPFDELELPFEELESLLEELELPFEELESLLEELESLLEELESVSLPGSAWATNGVSEAVTASAMAPAPIAIFLVIMGGSPPALESVGSRTVVTMPLICGVCQLNAQTRA
jgi:hypothetical protein